MCIQIPCALKELQEFSRIHFSPLKNAAFLLAGEYGSKRVTSLLYDILRATSLTRRIQLEIVELHKLLSLHYVDDPKRIESACFAEIDMGDPFIEEICLMTDGLTDILQRMELDENQPLASYLIAA